MGGQVDVCVCVGGGQVWVTVAVVAVVGGLVWVWVCVCVGGGQVWVTVAVQVLVAVDVRRRMFSSLAASSCSGQAAPLAFQRLRAGFRCFGAFLKSGVIRPQPLGGCFRRLGSLIEAGIVHP